MRFFSFRSLPLLQFCRSLRYKLCGMSFSMERINTKTPIMKSILTALFSIVVLFGVLSSAGAQGQVKVNTKMRIKIETETQKTPVFEAGGVNTKKIPYPRDWLEIEVKFKPEAAPRGAAIPKLMFKYYVAIKAKDGGTRLLTGEVTHVNVLGDEENFSCVYISPSTLGGITGDFRKFQTSSIVAVAVEVYHGGVLKGIENSDGRGNWWEQMAGTPGVIAKPDTPFALLWLDRYADVEEKRN